MQQSLFDTQTESQPEQQVSVNVSYTDRDYQAQAVTGAFQAFDAGEPGALIRAFTGAGKTYMGARVAAEWLNRSEKNRVFICAHERQLVNQFRDELGEFLGIPIGLEMSTDGSVNFGPAAPRVTVSCRATLAVGNSNRSRLYKFDREQYNWLLLIDEGHRWAYKLPSCRHILNWFEANENSKRLVLTATPERGDGVSLERIAPAVALDYPMHSAKGPSAIQDGWAVPFDQKFIHVEGVDFQELSQVAGDFDKKELEKILAEREQLMAMVTPLLDLAGDRQTLIFNAGVDLARAVARAINAERAVNGGEHGLAEWLDGSVDDDLRQDTFERHQRGEFQFLSVCGLCREGYNDPEIQCVAIFRPTKSKSLAEQMIGRGCRPLKGLLNGVDDPDERRALIAGSRKPNCRIIDMVGASGLGQCATTAHIYAIGDDDEEVPALEVSERANEIMMASDEDDPDGINDIGEAVKQAKAEIAEEREKARLEREAKERAEIEAKEKAARIKAEVRYEVSGDGQASRMTQTVPAPSDAQVSLLIDLGVSESEARRYSKRQASAVISKMIKSKKSPTPEGHDRQATQKQIEVLEKYGRPTDGLSFEKAAQHISDINRELNQKDAA